MNLDSQKTPSLRLVALCTKFGINKSYFVTYYETYARMQKTAARTKVQRIFRGAYPQDDKYLIDATYEKICYGFSKEQIQDYLRGTEKESGYLLKRIYDIEGLYEIVRFHADEQKFVLDYVTVNDGHIKYLAYKTPDMSLTFCGVASTYANHLQFNGKERSGHQQIFGMFEQVPFRNNFYAGIITGIADNKTDMVSYKMIARKIRKRVGVDKLPKVANFSETRLKRYEMLTAKMPAENTRGHFLAFSSGSIRKTK